MVMRSKVPAGSRELAGGDGALKLGSGIGLSAGSGQTKGLPLEVAVRRRTNLTNSPQNDLDFDWKLR